MSASKLSNHSRTSTSSYGTDTLWQNNKEFKDLVESSHAIFSTLSVKFQSVEPEAKFDLLTDSINTLSNSPTSPFTERELVLLFGFNDEASMTTAFNNFNNAKTACVASSNNILNEDKTTINAAVRTYIGNKYPTPPSPINPVNPPKPKPNDPQGGPCRDAYNSANIDCVLTGEFMVICCALDGAPFPPAALACMGVALIIQARCQNAAFAAYQKCK